MRNSIASLRITSASVLLLTALVFGTRANGQTTFTEVTPLNNVLFSNAVNEDFWVSTLAPADVDSDGDLDLAVFGYYVEYSVSVEHQLVLLKNNGADAQGNWQFTSSDVPLGDLYSGGADMAWGDFDADGDPDLVVGSEGLMVIYRNNQGVLEAMPNALPKYYEFSSSLGFDLSTLSWADVDNDLDLDLLVPNSYNIETRSLQTDLVRNDGANASGVWSFTIVPSFTEPTSSGHSRWADEDADGDLDLFLVDVDNGAGFIKRFTNNQGALALAQTLPVSVSHGVADWGDYDGDGDMDILVAGNTYDADQGFQTGLRIYTNEGSDQYTTKSILPSPSDDWLDIHAATWADYDSDGDMDLLITGNHVDYDVGQIVGKSRIYINTNNEFTMLDLLLPAPYNSLDRSGAISWLDIDNDGDLDYLVSGAYFLPNDSLVESQMHLYRNDSVNANSAPSQPSGLIALPVGSNVALSWETAIDDGTSASALTYEIAVRNVNAPATNVANKRIPEPGVIGNAFQWRLSDLPPGRYAWQVRAVDSAFNAGESAKGSFRVGVPRASLSATQLPPMRARKFNDFGYNLVNTTDAEQSYDLWYEVYDNSGNLLFTSGVVEHQLAPSDSVEKSIRMPISRRWDDGWYRTKVCFGLYPNSVERASQFRWRLLR